MRYTVRTFVDTSALYAALDADDEHHRRAGELWATLLGSPDVPVTSNYVLLETVALLGRRLGPASVRDFLTDFVPLLRVAWIGESLHQRAVAALLTAEQRDLSLVDCVSFELMREMGIECAFAFDRHFVQQGFQTV
jgi:predicted nucleic acid-binding protein